MLWPSPVSVEYCVVGYLQLIGGVGYGGFGFLVMILGVSLMNPIECVGHGKLWPCTIYVYIVMYVRL